MAPTSQDPQASRVCLGGTAPQDFLDLRYILLCYRLGVGGDIWQAQFWPLTPSSGKAAPHFWAASWCWGVDVTVVPMGGVGELGSAQLGSHSLWSRGSE